jgi:metallo-beta-lactamase family protein
MQLTFLGAAQTVTGSKFLLQMGPSRVLVDCGLFQGGRDLKDRNWSAFPVSPDSLDAVVLTHAHLDHSGYLPRLVRDGFKGPVYCTPATADLCKILLLDSAHLLERDAEFANRHGYSRHKPALSLYTVSDAEAALRLLRPVPSGTAFAVTTGGTAVFRPAGHILGASMVRIEHQGASVLFTGDLGRPNDPIMLEPAEPVRCDYLVIESTYGNRKHDTADVEQMLARVVTETARRGGVVLVPAFAVGRAQAILFHLHRLKSQGRLPGLPIYLDSPMAVDASDILCAHLDEHRLSADECRQVCGVAKYVRSAEESKMLDRRVMPMVLISASGMATGGRILHHLKVMAPDPRNTILLTGFQASGTRGAQLQAGAKELVIHGERVPVRAGVENMSMLSAHADADETMRWLHKFDVAPQRTFVVHGEANAAATLADRVRRELGWLAVVPSFAETVDLRPRAAESSMPRRSLQSNLD